MKYLFIGEQPEEEASLRWFYNPIHDMESVWWLFAWSTLNRDIYFVRPVSDSAPNTDASSSIGVVTRSRQRKLRQQLVLPPGEEAIDADDDQSRVREAYGDDTYRRLAEIKAMYDPDNVFHHNKNIQPSRPGT